MGGHPAVAGLWPNLSRTRRSASLQKESLFAAFLLTLWVALPAHAQIETQSQTYDLTLEDCLGETFTHNPDIARVRADVERAAGTKLVYRSRALPQLAGQVRGGGRFGTLYSPEGAFSALTAQFSQPLIDVGIPPTLRRGNVEVVIAQQRLNGEVTDRLHEVRVTFLRSLYYRDLVALYEDLSKVLKANIDREQQRLDVGTGSEAALKSAKIQELNLAHDLADLRTEYFSATTRLAELCGRDLREATNGVRQVHLPKPAGTLRYVPVNPDWTQAVAYAREHRADLKLLEALVNAAKNDQEIARAGYFPFVSLVSSALFIPEDVLLSKQTGVVPGQQTLASELRAGVALSWHIIDNGQVTGASRRFEAVRQGYEITLHKLEENIPGELATVKGALQNADARRDALLRSVDSAEENLKLIESQVALGDATQFDFLKAQENLLFVRTGVLDATYTHELARAELDRVLGRYLEYSATDAKDR